MEFEEVTQFVTPPEASPTPTSLCVVLLMELAGFTGPAENHDPVVTGKS